MSRGNFSDLAAETAYVCLSAVAAAFIFTGCAEIKPASRPPAPSTDAALPERVPTHDKFQSSKACRTCHTQIWEEQSRSMHAKSFENPVFQAHYFSNMLYRAREGERMYNEALSCGPCHMPIASLMSGGELVMRGDVDSNMSGVTCDLCHRISGYEGRTPGNGNFKASPGAEKYGPFRHRKPWHHVYLKLQTKSEFCAICHNAVNSLGVEVKPTYTEWLASPHRKKGIQCQDCHMNRLGYQIDGESLHDSGKAADMTLGSAPYRRKLYSHHFPGGRTKTQLANSLEMHVSTDRDIFEPGDEIEIRVTVDNSHTGHKVPSGSIELRYVWLDLTARSGDTVVSIPAVSVLKPGYDLSGAVSDDRAAIGANVPDGRRVYRAIFFDEDGKRTHSLVDAARKVFDNRLEPAEKRVETYRWRVPDSFSGGIVLDAKLNYVAYPESFSKMLKIPDAGSYTMSEADHVITVK